MCALSLAMLPNGFSHPEVISDGKVKMVKRSNVSTTPTADTYTCRFGRADFSPLRVDNGDWVAEFGILGEPFKAYINYCWPTRMTCSGLQSVYMLVNSANTCWMFGGSWDNIYAKETTYNGNYAIQFRSSITPGLGLIMVYGQSNLRLLSYYGSNPAWLVFESRYTDVTRSGINN